MPKIKTFKGLLSEVHLLEIAMEYSQLRKHCRPLELKLFDLPPLDETTNAVAKLTERIKLMTSQAITQDVDSRRGLSPAADRTELDGLRAALKSMRTGLEKGSIQAETFRLLSKRTPNIFQAFPCWAVTNLSVGSRIPLIPGIFDLAIVDEASQSDIPSAIPILFRARRAGVVGDPFQLTHVSKLSTSRDTMLRRQVGLKRIEDMRFAYTESSLLGLLRLACVLCHPWFSVSSILITTSVCPELQR